MVPYTGFNIWTHQYFWAWLYFQPNSRGIIFTIFAYLSLLISIWFSDVLITNQLYFFGRLISRPNINWIRLYPFNISVVERNVNASEAKMTKNKSSLSIWVSLIFYVHSRVNRTTWVLSSITLEVGFSDVLGLANILYSFWIRYFWTHY